MSTTTFEGPAILIGYQYLLQIETDAPLFEDGASFTAQLRPKVSAAQPVTTLTSAAGTLVRISDTTLELRIPPEATAQMAVGSVHVDVVRTDLVPPRHLSFFLEIPVAMPVTRGL